METVFTGFKPRRAKLCPPTDRPTPEQRYAETDIRPIPTPKKPGSIAMKK